MKEAASIRMPILWNIGIHVRKKMCPEQISRASGLDTNISVSYRNIMVTGNAAKLIMVIT